jgi:protein-S-isoprenylcysteine O-methyltransferase Ste14
MMLSIRAISHPVTRSENTDMTYPKAIVVAALLLASAIAFSSTVGQPPALAQSTSAVAVSAGSGTAASAWVVMNGNVYFCEVLNKECKAVTIKN